MDIKKIKTRNIANSISKFAQENLSQPSEYKFNINAVDTYIKTVADDDYVLYNEDIHNYYEDSDKIINKHVEFQQVYTITIKKTSKSIIDLKYSINFSDDNITPNIILHPDSKIPYKKYQPKEMYLLLLKELNNIKAREKILIKIFDFNMKDRLKAFIKYLYQGKFVNKIKLPLFDGIAPEVTVKSRLIKHYLKKKSSHQVIEVEPKELLIEYIKPVFGKNGLNAFGKITTHDYAKNRDDLDQSIIDTDSIKIVDDEKSRKYRSKIKGFVYFDENSFYVANKIKMQKLSSVQGSVAKDEDNNIEVIVAQHDTGVDSVGEGVHLKSETIHITGHIGAKSVIEASNLEIEGATHKDSKQEAKFAKINRHKGLLRCHSADIKLLEGGEVHATNVNIESSLGGTVYAENVTIGNVKNNLKVYASNSITVKLVSGENNLFKINYMDIPTLMSRCNFLNKELEDIKYELEGAMKHTETQVPVLREQINKLKAQQNEIKNGVKTAKITITEPLRGLNTITFTIDEDNELTYKTDARKYEPFYLEESDGYITLHPTDKKLATE